MKTEEILKKLCEASGVSGDESDACAAAEELLSELGIKSFTDSFNCVHAFIGDKDNDKPVVLLEAHIDEIGFIVTYIDECGFLKVASCGGTDRRLYAAQTVTVHTKNGNIRGVVSTLPPHVASDKKGTMKTEDISIDIGMTSAEQAEKVVSQGDRVTIDNELIKLIGTRFTGKAIDDRAGVCAVIYALELVKDKELPFNIEVLFASQEETGSRGAKIAAYNSCAKYCLATDVSFAYTPDDKIQDCGEMGKGVMIGVSPVLDRTLTDEINKICERKEIPFQYEIMSSSTGTDADHISVSNGGIRTALLSIPIKYMHTPAEIVDIKDIEAVGAAMAGFLCGGAENV